MNKIVEAFYDRRLTPGENIRLFRENFPRQPVSERMRSRGSRADSQEQKVTVQVGKGVEIVIRIQVRAR